MKLILSVEPVRFPLTGIGRYTYELALRLQKNPDITDLQFFAGRRFLADLPVANDESGSGYGLKRAVQKNFLAIEAYRLLMPLLRKQALKGHSDFLYHSPNYYLPPFAGPSVATFHDLSPFTWEHCHAPQLARYLQKELKTTLLRADALITDSDYTRRELAAYFGWPIERIHTVPLASSAEFHPRSPLVLRDVLERHGLQFGGYSLFVGTIEPRKNIETLLDSYARLPLALRVRWPLILTGYHGWQNDAIHQRLESAKREGWAHYLGFVPSDDLPLLFAGARLFVFPSLYEGFGLPVLEAMSSGIPVVCSNSSSLPEVAGKAALMCEPTDVEALTALIQRGLEDESWRASAMEQGLLHAASFSWERCAMETLHVYKTVVSGS
ncbi:glycosyltransferase family 1 protein [Pseudomonas sp. CCI3.2]|uniref:glycosyltransferase family 4 protein n=1 Tax=unclassified Pseudomonas TaxID=196821 RepID=UPI002AC9EE03|nr:MULTISPECIES: glycosyltransferase family 1 protein [unclassified Pseudomonas]MEB0075957.1 glycosyltransferase family 1 protein [Pseudomonas sp. MH10out]MEB0093666.1 glycosyltransferase family 1 protein [Pseudomonas sp. CCI4.2]MEB0101402.1 glycosyltransferase family 1 protein [Pseudomonas sp. CCI3.2]MEB0130936.1 glycosyltransferase family 1 protein [Pseudomonas sp. CCI2.4]MEB0157914.1 glycosyltransferase family 1 protein [Pseudomonas sp. AH2 (2023)]